MAVKLPEPPTPELLAKLDRASRDAVFQAYGVALGLAYGVALLREREAGNGLLKQPEEEDGAPR